MTWTLIAAIASTAVLTAVVTALTTSKRMRKKVSYMLDALEDKELNFRFDERRIFGRHFNKTLNRLKNIFDKERQEIAEQEKYFGLIFGAIGVLIVGFFVLSIVRKQQKKKKMKPVFRPSDREAPVINRAKKKGDEE